MVQDDKQRSDTARTTDAPPAIPTIIPAFDVELFAREVGGGHALVSDTVLEVVSDISWTAAKLDLVEMEVLEQIDGVAPVMLLESMIPIARDELHAILSTLLARGILGVVGAKPPTVVPRSGAYVKPGLPGLQTVDDDVASTG